jgi:hypothetical protein
LKEKKAPMRLRYSIVVLAFLPIGIAVGQYHETKTPFKGTLKLDDGNTFQVAQLVIPNSYTADLAYIKDVRLIGKGSSGNKFAVASAAEIDFVAMAPEEEKKACTGGGADYIIPCMNRKANVRMADGTELKNIYIGVHGLEAVTPDGDKIELNEAKYKVLSLIRDPADNAKRGVPKK